MKNLTSLGRYGTVGLEFVITFCLGLFGGQWLDKRWGTSYMIWVGMVVGSYAGFRAVFKAAKEAQRAIDREDREEPGKYHSTRDDEGEVDEGYDGSDWKAGEDGENARGDDSKARPPRDIDKSS